MIEFALPPAFVLIFGALLTALVGPALRAFVVLIAPLLTLYAVWQVGDGVLLTAPFLGFELELVEGSKVRRLFATVFAIMAFAGGLFAYRQAKWNELAAAHAYAAGAIGVSFAGDLITFFIFWEIMALFSTVVVWCGGSDTARAAGIRYAIMHFLGGVILKIGIVGLVLQTGDIDVRVVQVEDLFGWLILIGVLINTAAPPLSAWLPDAYPEASPSGAVFLSAFTTKTAVLALILLFPGTQVLIWVGLYMIFYGIIYALLENDMRRILAYSIVNQVGFMVAGVGIGTEMAINGAAAHAFAHIIYKALLLMSAGSVLYMTGRRKCSELGGLFQSMPLTTLCGTIGALAISSFPFTSGFISKSMVTQGAANEHMMLVWFLLIAASAGVFLHAGIKFPWFVFFQKDSGLRPPEPPWNMRLAMILFAFLCIWLGIFPDQLYAMLPYPVEYEPYTADHLVSQFQLLLFAGLAFFVMLPMMRRTETISLDTDWLYRRFGKQLLRHLVDAISKAGTALEVQARSRLQMLIDSLFRSHGPQGVLARTWPTGSMALWMAIVLGGCLIFYYL